MSINDKIEQYAQRKASQKKPVPKLLKITVLSLIGFVVLILLIPEQKDAAGSSTPHASSPPITSTLTFPQRFDIDSVTKFFSTSPMKFIVVKRNKYYIGYATQADADTRSQEHDHLNITMVDTQSTQKQVRAISFYWQDRIPEAVPTLSENKALNFIAAYDSGAYNYFHPVMAKLWKDKRFMSNLEAYSDTLKGFNISIYHTLFDPKNSGSGSRYIYVEIYNTQAPKIL